MTAIYMDDGRRGYASTVLAERERERVRERERRGEGDVATGRKRSKKKDFKVSNSTK